MSNPLSTACYQAISENLISLNDLSKRFDNFSKIVEESFNQASSEPKLNSRKDLIDRNSAP